MSNFIYTLPSGATFELKAPTGTTQAQADEVFYTQVAAGSLVNYSAGQTLQSTETLIESFELSRLQRGTAGIDAVTVLALNAGLPVVATVPTLDGVQISDAVTETDVALMRLGLGSDRVGVLTPIEVQTLQAQLAAQVNQSFDVMTNERGIGMFGFSSWQLEQLGYLFPGTTARYLNNSNDITNPANFTAVMNSPYIWTGLNGVTGVNQILGSRDLQMKIQTALMKQSYSSLLAAGLITDTSTQAPSYMVGQVYSASSDYSGVFQPVAAANLLTTPPATLATFSQASAQSFINSVISKAGFLDSISPANLQSMLNGIVSTPSLLRGLPTSDLEKFTSLISDKIKSLPSVASTLSKPLQTGVTNGFSLDSLGSSLKSLTSQANSLISGVTGVGSQVGNLAGGATGALSSAQGVLSSAASTLTQAQNVATQVQGQVGALVNTASKYGTQATALWNKGLEGNLKDAMDSVGKMGDYAVKFAKDKISGLVSQVKQAAGFLDTVNRKTVDVAVNKIIGTPSITPPTFSMPPLPNSPGDIMGDIKFAQNVLSQAQTQVSNLTNQVTAPINQAISATQNLAGQVQGQIAQVTGAVSGVANQGADIIGQVSGQASGARGLISRLTRLG